MNHGRYVRLFQAAFPLEILNALRDEFDIQMSMFDVDKERMAKRNTPPPKKPPNKPKYRITKKFFSRLFFMPFVELQVRDSASKIRKTCYGFRDPDTKERVYLRMDGDSLLEFRDSPAGFMIGKRYYIPRLAKMRHPRTFEKLNRLLMRILRERGTIVKSKHVREYIAYNRRRYKLANLLVARRNYTQSHTLIKGTERYIKECLNEKTI